MSILPRLQSTSQYHANRTAQLGQFIASSFSRLTASSATASVSFPSSFTRVHAASPSFSFIKTNSCVAHLLRHRFIAPVSTSSELRPYPNDRPSLITLDILQRWSPDRLRRLNGFVIIQRGRCSLPSWQEDWRGIFWCYF